MITEKRPLPLEAEHRRRIYLTALARNLTDAFTRLETTTREQGAPDAETLIEYCRETVRAAKAKAERTAADAARAS